MALGFTTGGGIEAGENDDMSDVSWKYTSNTGGGTNTLVNVSTSGVWLGGAAFLESDRSSEQSITYTVDGTSTTQTGRPYGDWTNVAYYELPPVVFQNSLQIEVQNTNRDLVAIGSLKS